MRIKTKLNLGIGLLFTLIVLLALLSIRQINLLATASENILKDNKETIFYIQEMLKSLSEVQHNDSALSTFEEYLDKQKANITEVGEKERTQNLTSNFNEVKKNVRDDAAIEKTQLVLFEIMEINLKAIEQKNTIASNTANRSAFIISLLSLFCFSIALVLFLSLPGSISNPIKELIKSIKLIAANDYSQRVNFEDHNELGELATAYNTMAMKLDEYNKSNISKLMAEKKVTETLINKIPYPIIGFDKSMKITLVNEEFLKIAGLGKHELLEHNILEMATSNELIGQMMLMHNELDLIVSNKHENQKIRVGQKGKDVYFEKEIQEIAFYPRESDDKQLLGYFIVLKNVTKYMELDLAKTNFIATISHELKTPISAIKFSLQLLENEKTGVLNGEQLALLKSCEEDSNKLLKLVSELLNMAQSETGNIQLNILPASLIDILHYAVNATKPLAEQKGISVNIVYPEYLSEILADKEKTAWVLTNIISNAIRYSDDHSTISVFLSETQNKQIISVKDQGRGIAPQYIDRIFDRYFRVPDNNKEGSGLGLAICKEFIEAQGGTITVESEYETGSTFSIYFDLNKI
ncbi:MAG: HAMP domain-containing protein, partial [Prolixibacteraceae bacterium]|nr:HAMP domain-containing protein [Prolixibacteraceae bacterium]